MPENEEKNCSLGFVQVLYCKCQQEGLFPPTAAVTAGILGTRVRQDQAGSTLSLQMVPVSHASTHAPVCPHWVGPWGLENIGPVENRLNAPILKCAVKAQKLWPSLVTPELWSRGGGCASKGVSREVPEFWQAWYILLGLWGSSKHPIITNYDAEET